VIDYYLKRDADKVTIEMLDNNGNVIRTFTGTAEADKRRPGGGGEDSEFAGPPAARPPARKAGTNRFAWDLRYPGAIVFEGMILWSARAEAGPLAVPGNYQVRLTANGQTQTLPLTVKKDPRLTGITEDDLAEQFKLALQVRDKTSEANQAVILIRELKKQLKDRSDKAKLLTAASEALSQKLSAIEEEIYQVRNRSSQDPLNFPVKLNNQIAALRRSIETGDGRPTEGSYLVFRELSAALAVQTGKLNELLQRDLAAFNELLAPHKLEPIRATAAQR
jgi:hypothetical protein